MSAEIQIVNLYQPWLVLPEIPAGFTMTKPDKTLIHESPEYEFTDAQLREFAISGTNLLFGLVIDATKIAALPEGYLLSLYLNMRFANPPMAGTCPTRQADRLIVNQHTFGDLCILAACLSRLYLIQQKTINPTTALKATNTFRLLQRCYWGMYESLQRFTQFDTSEKHVFAQQTLVGTGGEEDHAILYVDSIKHQAWLDAGHSETELIDWWLANGTDPVV